MSVKDLDSSGIASLLAQYESRLGENAPMWTILDQFVQKLPRHRTGLDSTSVRETKRELAIKFAHDVELPLLFCAINKAHRDGHKKRIRDVDETLECVFTAPVGFQMLQEREDLRPFLCAALDVSQPLSIQNLAIRALRALSACNSEDSSDNKPIRCHWLLTHPAASALVLSVGYATTAIAESAASLLIDLLRGTRHSQDARGLMLEILMEVDSACKNENSSMAIIRYAELVARCCAIGDNELVSAQESGALELVVKLVKGENPISTSNSESSGELDPLLRLNAFELVPHIAKAPAGARFILTSGLAESLLNVAESDSSTVPLSTGALRLVAEIMSLVSAASGPSSPLPSEKLPVARRMLKLATSFLKITSNEAVRMAGLSAVADFGRSSAWALQLVLEDEQLCRSWLSLEGDGGGLVLMLKAATLHSVARVLGPPLQTQPPMPSLREVHEMETERDAFSDASDSSMTDVEPGTIPLNTLSIESNDDELSELRRRLWLRFGGCNMRNRDIMDSYDEGELVSGIPEASPIGLLVTLIKQPVSEIQHAAFDVLRCAAHQRGGWGLRDILSDGSLMSLLTSGLGADVMVNGRDGMEWKFSLVESIMSCPEKSILGETMFEFLERVIRNGPFGPPLTLSINVPQ